VTRLRVAHVAGSADVGGGERYLELLARHLDRERFELAVIVPEPGPLAARLEDLGVPVATVDLRRLVSVTAVARLASQIRAFAPHIVQSHGARSNFYTRLAGAMAGVRIRLSTVHNALGDYPVSVARRAVYRLADHLTLPLTSAVICVAHALGRDYPRRALVIPNGIELEHFDPAAVAAADVRQRWGLSAGPVVGFVGRLTPQKDPLTFLRVVADIRRHLPDVNALVVGDGPLRGAVEAEIARLELRPSCRLTGMQAEVAPLLGAMDVFVLSSVSEGFPFVVLEAMAMERPVVATEVNGVAEIIEPGISGVLVAPRAPDAIARAALALLRAPAGARRMGRAARARVAERFTVAGMVDRLQTLYATLVSSDSRRVAEVSA
jgi:glycosyltransferase involved in cell wall biosynthesis